MKPKTALYISVICHPLITLPLFTIVTLASKEEVKDALLHSSIIILGLFLPLTLSMYKKYKKGSYTDFDVSNKTERRSWYKTACMLLLMVTIVLFATEQPRELRMPVFFSLLLLLSSQIMNYFINRSLHVALTIFLAFLTLPMNLEIAVIFIMLTILVGWARIILNRHTVIEVLAGFIIGTCFGISSLLFADFGRCSS